ncbi:hypothetical protein DPMN_161674 [Dreissena polymorpha]|uniref:Uncharacterized protein n=1 Tax=Dreissena polymorpha TaxID=45954 RepID=A0A9D4ESK4_DREPO|nr:hypothetical protein DPMN_161674 [Dreissena polymorpha]
MPTVNDAPPQPVMPTVNDAPPQPVMPTYNVAPPQPVMPTVNDAPPQPVMPTYKGAPPQPVMPTFNVAPPQPVMPTVNDAPPQPVMPTYKGAPPQPVMPTFNVAPPQPVMPTNNTAPPQPVIPTYNGAPPQPVMPTYNVARPQPLMPTYNDAPPQSPIMMVTRNTSSSPLQTESYNYEGPLPPLAVPVRFALDMLNEMEEQVGYEDIEASNGNPEQGVSHPCSCCRKVDSLQVTVQELQLQVKSLERLVERSQSTAPRVQTPTRPIPVRQHLQAIQDGNLSTEEKIKAAIQHEPREAKALQRAMRAIFSPQQLVSCSMKGAFTCRHGAPRPGLPHEDTAIIIEQVSQKYGTSIPEVEKKFR